MGDCEHAVSRVLAECQFADDMLQPPRADFDAVFMADLQERPEPGLKLAGGAGESAFGFEPATGHPLFLVP